ncbi:uncharacterized protein LOC133525651 [Cydia pomonella]|uniref:uncharacterized protein LOC133525651 n=1 Tax=Cydia pomonella TaxID=82600 RepID=UPI002ADD92A1|nr:uncharacterized protein LOC133525651 [Cydia pomonella]
MSKLGMFKDLLHMDHENHLPVQVKPKVGNQHDCLRTSEKIRFLLAKFPSAKPIYDLPSSGYSYDVCGKCTATISKSNSHPIPPFPDNDLDTEVINGQPGNDPARTQPDSIKKSQVWNAVTEVVQLVQLVVTATAFALYYVIYGWMQLVYHGLRVAMFFRDSDGPTKITLGVVGVTSIIVGCNILLRIRKIYSDILR